MSKRTTYIERGKKNIDVERDVTVKEQTNRLDDEARQNRDNQLDR